MTSMHFTEKQVGLLFFVFGVSQVIFMGPAGYFLDYSNSKIKWVIYASAAVSLLTVLTAVFAEPDGENMTIMIIIHFIQGAATSIFPSGFNAITLGIVGCKGFTHQVSRNKMMSHLGTALIVSIASLLAYFLYPNIGHLFIVSPLAGLGVVYYLRKIKPEHVDSDAARCFIRESSTMKEYETMDEENEVAEMMTIAETQGSGVVGADDSNSDVSGDERSSSSTSSAAAYSAAAYAPPKVAASNLGKTENSKIGNESQENEVGISSNNEHKRDPSFIFGMFMTSKSEDNSQRQKTSPPEDKTKVLHRARTPLSVLIDKTFLMFTFIVFLFHASNSAVLPLVMQSLTADDQQEGILLSGLCIFIAQLFMMFFAKICGDHSPVWGRKNLFLLGLFSLPLRCLLLVTFLEIKKSLQTSAGENLLKALILSTQLLDAVGAGIFGTLYILVTNDISEGTGRFSLMLGITTSAMCLGGTVSGYVGQALAQDYGYNSALRILGIVALLPAFLYFFFMPETLPEYARKSPDDRKKQRKRLLSVFKRLRRGMKKHVSEIIISINSKEDKLPEEKIPSTPRVTNKVVESERGQSSNCYFELT